MANVNINTKPTVTTIDNNDQIFISDDGVALKKINYTDLAKAIIEQYNASQLAGSAQSVKSALDVLNSNVKHVWSTSSLLTNQVDALAYPGFYVGALSSYGKQQETGVPENEAYFCEVYTTSSNYASIRLTATSGVYSKVWEKKKTSGTWGSWILLNPIISAYQGTIVAHDSIDIPSPTSHVTYLISYGTWNMQSVWLVMPTQGNNPRGTCLFKYSESANTKLSFSANGQYGITITNESDSLMPVNVSVMWKATSILL